MEEDALFCTSCGESVAEETKKTVSLDKEPSDAGDDLTLPLTDVEDAADSYEAEDAAEDEAFDGETGDVFNYDAEDQEADGESAETGDDAEEIVVEDRENHFAQGNKMPIAVILFAAAALAIVGFLFVDRLFLSNSKDTRATTIRIISQSEDVTVAKNTPTEFFVDAQGTNLTYQWYYRKSGDQMWHIWKNHNMEKTQSVANESWNGMEVYCMITDNNRTAVASEVIRITIEK